MGNICVSSVAKLFSAVSRIEPDLQLARKIQQDLMFKIQNDPEKSCVREGRTLQVRAVICLLEQEKVLKGQVEETVRSWGGNYLSICIFLRVTKGS